MFSMMTSQQLRHSVADTDPHPTSTNVDVFGLTDRGRVRSDNQDQFLIASLHKLLRVHQSNPRGPILSGGQFSPHIANSHDVNHYALSANVRGEQEREFRRDFQTARSPSPSR